MNIKITIYKVLSWLNGTKPSNTYFQQAIKPLPKGTLPQDKNKTPLSYNELRSLTHTRPLSDKIKEEYRKVRK